MTSQNNAPVDNYAKHLGVEIVQHGGGDYSVYGSLARADVRRVAILPADDMDYSPILLRIPGASLGDLAAFGKALKQRGIPYAAVVTKLSFDPDASFPKILFQFERVLTPEEMAAINAYLAHAWDGRVWMRGWNGALVNPGLFEGY